MNNTDVPPLLEQEEKTHCYHCGDSCEEGKIQSDDKNFCCQGCKSVFELFKENDLCDYYSMEVNPGISQNESRASLFDYLENEQIKAQLLDFASPDYEKVTLYIPAIHCSSCIWLLEHLDRLNSAVISSQVDFARKKLSIQYRPREISLSDLASILDQIGYSPVINLEDAEKEDKPRRTYNRKLLIKMGIAGFCFGNVMLLSFPDYLGLTDMEKTYQSFFRYLIAFLSLPVVFYAGADYFVSAAKSVRQRYANIDVPIALGVSVLFLRSMYEVIWDVGPGYFDSLVGLIFFLLIGKWFQDKTYQSITFDRDYKSYFPLAVQKRVQDVFKPVPVKELEKGDEILIRNGEVIPADAILLNDGASIDYSFVTGESTLIQKQKGDLLFAGGRQAGKSIRLITQKQVSQSYLTKLWNNKAFSEGGEQVRLVDKVARYFTLVIIGIAVAAALYWSIQDSSKTWLVFCAVLIIACPCALALATPFTTGSVMRVFGRNRFYLKNADVVERLKNLDVVVFDKTGTLTSLEGKKVSFQGEELSLEEQEMLHAAVSSSTHPMSRLMRENLDTEGESHYFLEQFEEVAGKGILAMVSGVEVRLGSAKWLNVGDETNASGSKVYIKIGNKLRGHFLIQSRLRKGIPGLIDQLRGKMKLALLSGDNNSERSDFESLFPAESELRFNQKPADKLKFIQERQEQGAHVLMLGDGLNDAGALKASTVGVAVTDNVSMFSPASDAVLEGASLSKLDRLLKLGNDAHRIIIASFVLSFLYNVGGIGFAVMGKLTPIVAAVLMPLSSISVVIFSSAMVRIAAARLKLLK